MQITTTLSGYFSLLVSSRHCAMGGLNNPAASFKPEAFSRLLIYSLAPVQQLPEATPLRLDDTTRPRRTLDGSAGPLHSVLRVHLCDIPHGTCRGRLIGNLSTCRHHSASVRCACGQLMVCCVERHANARANILVFMSSLRGPSRALLGG